MKNANRENAKGEDFFSLSARCYIDLLIWFLNEDNWRAERKKHKQRPKK